MNPKNKYFKVTKSDASGSFITIDLAEVSASIGDNEVGDKYTLEVIELTDGEFEALPDFQGW